MVASSEVLAKTSMAHAYVGRLKKTTQTTHDGGEGQAVGAGEPLLEEAENGHGVGAGEKLSEQEEVDGAEDAVGDGFEEALGQEDLFGVAGEVQEDAEAELQPLFLRHRAHQPREARAHGLVFFFDTGGREQGESRGGDEGEGNEAQQKPGRGEHHEERSGHGSDGVANVLHARNC